MTQQPTSTPSTHCPLCGAEHFQERILERFQLSNYEYLGISEMVALCTLLDANGIKYEDKSVGVAGIRILKNQWKAPCGTLVTTFFGTETKGHERGLLESYMPGEDDPQGDLTAKEIVDAWLAVPVGASS